MPKLSKTRITNKILADLDPGKEVADAEIRGLTARRSKPSKGSNGTVSYSLRYRVAGQQRRVALGLWPGVTIDAARKAARALLGQVSDGKDPSAERAAKRKEMTLGDLWERWMKEHGIHLKPATLHNHRGRYRRHVEKTIGGRKVSSISRGDLADLHRKVGEKSGKPSANALIRMLSAMYGWALSISTVKENPCVGLKMYKEKGRERYLSPEERARLWARLQEIEDAGGVHGRGHRIPLGAIHALRLLLLTGARREEIAGLGWDEVDIERCKVHLSETKTDRSSRPITRSCAEYLQRIKDARTNLSPYVCQNSKGGRVTTLKQIWDRIREDLGLEDVVLHVFRHSFASDGLAAGMTLAEIGAYLGHKSIASTMRYAHLADDAAKEAGDKVDQRMKAAHEGRLSPSKVIHLKKAK